MTTNPMRAALDAVAQQLHDDDPAEFHGTEATRCRFCAEPEQAAPVSSAVSVVPPATNQTAPVDRAAELAALVRDFLDPDRCQLDHHGYCQAHSWMCGGSRCPHARAREVLAEIDSEEQAVGSCVAAEAPHTETPGDDWQQCPASEFDGYGLQCQKPAGHNLCTFEEEPAARAEDASPVESCPPGCVACATDESHDPQPAAGMRQDGEQP